MTIREAARRDIDVWSDMRTALWPKTEDQHLAEINAYFDNQSIDIEQVFLIEVNSEVIGFLELNIRDFAEGSRQSAVPYVEAWYIKPDFQGQGFGKSLMEKAEQWALRLGYSELASDTEIDNELSISLHKKMGFQETERVVCFLKTLDVNRS